MPNFRRLVVSVNFTSFKPPNDGIEGAREAREKEPDMTAPGKEGHSESYGYSQQTASSMEF